MDLPYQSFVGSSPFRFLVGPQKKAFYVHADLVAKSSSSLNVLVKGQMKEASQKYAILKDVDEDMMAPFIEYLYTKDYTVPDPRIILDSPDIECSAVDSNLEVEAETQEVDPIEEDAEEAVDPEALIPVLEDDSWISFGKNRRKKSRKNNWREDLSEPPAECTPPPEESYPAEWKKDRAWAAFEEKVCVQHRDAWEPYQNTEPDEDYTEVFLCHARLYVFSDQHGIQPLQELSLQKLRLTLSRFRLFDERVPDIVELVRYAYAHTMEHDNGIDTLRSLVIAYVVCKLENIVNDEGFKEMLEEPGALAKDLLLKLMQRLD